MAQTYRNIQLSYWGDVFVACRLRDLGLSFETFLADPIEAVRSVPHDWRWRQWSRRRSVSATKLAKIVTSPKFLDRTTEADRKQGDAEHQRHNRLVRRFQQ